ncbi:hypothetical protein WN48_04634 [Eufriesea mexicana]|uniref:Uncharacterized protein n=1 Tax=Eufriesea mexicana TaxID=516756 RepID=A0A310SM00_9HYME|nr:hypothetical protein WN48_04634 [Eufriesea mexicana]
MRFEKVKERLKTEGINKIENDANLMELRERKICRSEIQKFYWRNLIEVVHKKVFPTHVLIIISQL